MKQHGIRTAFFTSTYLLRKSHSHSPSPSTHDRPSLDNKFTPNPFLEASLANPETGSHHLNPHHVAHCFDYLRQALMCAADSNLEDVVVMDDESGTPVEGAPGWGTKRVCRDFEGLRAWSEKWRAGEGNGIM